MNAQWKKFDRSEEQISEILNAKDGVKIKYIRAGDEAFFLKIVGDFSDIEIAEYLICQPHPHADMIIEWARTGREVYWEVDKGTWCLDHNPQWLHGLKYSFNPDGDGK